jgi:U3 small nucleolar ribonucleoprotein protein LCP5
MAANVADLLSSLQQSLNSAQEATPKLVGIEPPQNGISLLETKNELLLSYLQNLVFLILLKLRELRPDDKSQEDGTSGLRRQVVEKLAELRLYLEQGVRPLEDKLHYMIDNVLRAANDADRVSAPMHSEATVSGHKKGEVAGDWESLSGESSADDSNGDAVSRQAVAAAEKQHRPLLAALAASESSKVGKSKKSENAKTGAYKPPRITPISMPTTERRERIDRRPKKSATLDEFINNELSSAPVAEPSIGTTIVARGRRSKTTAERTADAERADYEEQNFVRLPNESKKERKRKAKLEGRSGRMEFGGEEFTNLGLGADRISRLTRGQRTGGTRGLLERSRKRGIDTVDGPRGSGNSEGVQMGEKFHKRVRLQEGGRDRGKKRSLKL